MSSQTSISFAEQDLVAFSEASGDRNPLHLNEEYARRTPYGQPVVFGCLGAMACLGQIRLPAGWSATSLEAKFLRPMFLGVIYRIETSKKEGRWGARLFDGTLPVVSVMLTAEISHGNETPEEIMTSAALGRSDPALRKQEDILPGLEISRSEERRVGKECR